MTSFGNLGTAGRPRRLIFTLLGGYWEVLGDWVRLRVLVGLLEDLGLTTKAARAATDRLVEQGMLSRERRDGEAGLVFTPAMVARIEQRSRRIFVHREPARLVDGWLLVSYSLPESERDRRHLLRSGLEQLGFASMGAGQWLAPAWLKTDVVELGRNLGVADQMTLFVGQFEGFGHLRDLVERCWDLPALGAQYREFVQLQGPQLAKLRLAPAVDPLQAYVSYTMALHTWRIMPVLDPSLPAEVLPADWPGNQAADLFFELRKLLYPAAREYVEAKLVEPSR